MNLLAIANGLEARGVRFVIATGADIVNEVKWLFYDACEFGICFGTRRTQLLQRDIDGRWHDTGETEPCPCTI